MTQLPVSGGAFRGLVLLEGAHEVRVQVLLVVVASARAVGDAR